MILVVIVAVFAIAGNIVLWRRISSVDARCDAIFTESHARLDAQARAHIEDLINAETEFVATIAVLRAELLATIFDSRYNDTDLRLVLAGIVDYLDDVPQNFAFNKEPNTHYRLRLPDHLRLELHQS